MPCYAFTDFKGVSHAFFIVPERFRKVGNGISFAVVFEQTGKNNGGQFLVFVQNGIDSIFVFAGVNKRVCRVLRKSVLGGGTWHKAKRDEKQSRNFEFLKQVFHERNFHGNAPLLCYKLLKPLQFSCLKLCPICVMQKSVTIKNKPGNKMTHHVFKRCV